MTVVLVTGAAGFIGFHVAHRWLSEGAQVIGLDSFSDYYDVKLKEERSAILEAYPNYTGIRGRLEDPGQLSGIMAEYAPTLVVHLAAQAGVRHSIEAPRSYVESNLLGTFELLEAARANPPKQLLLASTSSVYGANTSMPYGETDKADLPVSFYAATKKATEAMAHSYAHLYGLSTIMFRFFTVYGPWGRPDMAYFKFAKAILAEQTIDIYNQGKMKRDFTYVDDLIEAIWRLAKVDQNDVDRSAGLPAFDTLSPVAPFRVVNIGKSKPDDLIDFVTELEKVLGKSANKNFLGMQPGDVHATESRSELLEHLTGYRCTTALSDGLPKFVDWYRNHYG